LSVTSLARFGSDVSILDFFHLGSSLSLRSIGLMARASPCLG
jgi:hypothetical protein